MTKIGPLLTWLQIGVKSTKMSKKIPYYLLPILLLPWLWQSCDEENVKQQLVDENPTFVGSNSCSNCHAQETKSWGESHHFHSMELATNTTVKAPFKGEKVNIDEVKYEFLHDTSGYYAHITEKKQPTQIFKIEYTFGFYPLQQYLVELPNGKLQTLRVSYDTKENKWFHQYSGELIKVHDWLHWSQQSMNWNSMCADCHSTQVKKNYHPENETYKSSFSEVNVSCESCHGPASNHIIQSKKGEFNNTKGFITKTEKSNYTNTCGRCHSRRSKLQDGHDFKEGFYDQYQLVTLDLDHYQPDGQIREEDFVLGSFLSSKMGHRGITCHDCHDAHSNDLKKVGNSLCLSCHTESYNKPDHHFHAENSKGSQCINCHMPGKTYMGNDFRRDHSFRVPRPDQSVTYGTTNACTQCHTDKNDEWAAEFLKSRNNGHYPKHFSDLLLKARFENDLKSYLTLIADTSYPNIARATAVGELQNFPIDDWINPIREIAANHSSPLLRSMFQKALFNQVNPKIKDLVLQGLNDTSLTVRVIAYRNALKLPEDIRSDLPMKMRSSEYEDYLRYNADFKEGRNQWAEWSLSHGQNDLAIEKYEHSLLIDSIQSDPYINLAILKSQKNENGQALNLLSIYVQKFPKDAYGYYLKGILNVEENNFSQGIDDLKMAIELNPYEEKYWKNLLNVYQITQNKQGIESLKKKYNEIFNS